MKIKHIILLGGLFLFLLGVVYAKKALLKPQIEVNEYKKLEVSFNKDDVYKIEIKKADTEAIVLERKADEWRIASKWGVRGRRGKIEDFLNNLLDVEGELRSSSKNLFSDYGITEDKAISIGMFGKEGQFLERFYIGVVKPGFGTMFLRKGPSQEVFLVNKDIFPLLGVYRDTENADIKVDNLMDLEIAKFNVEEAELVRITRFEDGHEIVSVDIKKVFDEEKNLNKWVYAAGGEDSLFDIDAKKVNSFLKKVSALSVSDILDSGEKDYGFQQFFVKVYIETKDSGSVEIIVGDLLQGDKEDRYVTSSEGLVYILGKYGVSSLNIDMSKFFIDNPLRMDTESLKKVIIKHNKNTITLDKEDIKNNANYINGIKSFSVDSMLLSGDYSAGFPIPTKYSFSLERDNGETLVLHFKDEEEGRYFCQIDGRKGVFIISGPVFDKIFGLLGTSPTGTP